MAFEKFFFLLCDASFNLLPYLSQLELSSQDLVFLLLKGTLSFFKSSLQFHFLSLKPLPDLVNLMNGSASFRYLIHDVLDFITQTFVFFTHLI